jgi:asparagine synthase (glutamine-hydrolysing)
LKIGNYSDSRLLNFFMCGIVGLISPNAEGRIRAMLETIAHRGRDDAGVWSSAQFDDEGRRVCLGHRRLSIIDTSAAGHQPMRSRDGRFVITFNGEIYNYRELREELKARGHEFTSDCDTEVLLEAFDEWGAECLPRLNGMFAFAVWDEREKELTLARDRLGIKPLYYADLQNVASENLMNGARGEASGAFLFASEIKAILAAKLLKPALDLEGLNQFLTFLWTPDPHTLFQHIKTLPPAHVLTRRRDGSVHIREWWDVSFDEIETDKSETEWQERVFETLKRVVRMEMVADVPLGAFLSGGLDSSVLVALMTHLIGDKKRRISTYTTGILPEDLRFDIIPDDVRWARKVGELFKTDYQETMLQPDVVSLLPKLVYHADEPVIDMAIPSYLISRAARERLTVMLSGMGGDEVFAGYPRQMAMQIAGAFDALPTMVRNPLMRTVASAMPGGLPGRFTAPLRNAKKFARSAALDFESRYLGFGTYFTDEMKRQLYNEATREATREFDAYKYHRRYFERTRGAHPLNRLLYVDLKTFLPCLNLMTTDKTSMAATLEVRVPYLNVELVELAARMPAELKLKGLKRKYILKRVAEKLLPADVVWRKKAGFSAPVRAWLRGALREMVEDLLSESAIKKRGLFRPSEVRRIIDANLSGREDYNLQVFQLLTFELWQRAFLD